MSLSSVAFKAAAKASESSATTCILCVISPAKSLKSEEQCSDIALKLQPTLPTFIDEADDIAKIINKSLTHSKIMSTMKVSSAIADGVVTMIDNYVLNARNPHDVGQQAGVLYDGPAYKGLQYETLNLAESQRAERCVRFLSGLYGLLRPNDSIQAYRLEMSVKPKDIGLEGAKDLAVYWAPTITASINSILTAPGSILLNVASEEYSKAINRNDLGDHIRVISVRFLDDGKIKTAYAKKARGLMCRFVATNPAFDGNPSEATMIAQLKLFKLEGYKYSASDSETDDSTLCFTRGAAEARENTGGGGKKRKV